VEILGKLGRNEIMALLVIKRKKGICSVSYLFRVIGSTDYAIIYRLLEAGLIEVRSEIAFYPLRLVWLTEKGRIVAEYLSKIAEIINTQRIEKEKLSS